MSYAKADDDVLALGASVLTKHHQGLVDTETRQLIPRRVRTSTNA